MQTTPNGIPFPESSDNVRLWEHFAQLAAAIDPQLDMPVRQVFTASGTWTKPDGAKWLRVQVLGAGGGGGGVPGTTASTAAAGGGGGGGGYAESIIAAASVGESVAVTVGAGGAAGAALNGVGSGNPAGDGGTGGSSSFGAFVAASGGSGGSGGLESGSNQARAGGLAGIGTAGDVLLRGGDGGNTVVLNGVPVLPGNGGTCWGGSQRRAPAVTGSRAAGSDANSDGRWGSGGGGAIQGTAANSNGEVGGIGGSGLVIVTTYF